MSDDRAQGATAAAEVAEKEVQLVETVYGIGVAPGVLDSAGASGGDVGAVANLRPRFRQQYEGKLSIGDFAKLIGVSPAMVIKLMRAGTLDVDKWEGVELIPTDTKRNKACIDAYTACLSAVELAKELGTTRARVKRVAKEMFILPTHARGTTNRNVVWDKVECDALRRVLKK